MSDALEMVFEKSIDLGKVRAMLAEARARASRDQDERICTLNLVATYFSPSGFDKARPALEAAGAVHPCRLIALVSEPHEPGDAVHVEVSVIRSGASVAHERVVFTATGTAVRHLQSAMLGLLIPEVPVVFVWGGRPEGPLFWKALENADRVIIDSATRPLQTLIRTSELVAEGAPVGDLAWARIFPWQATAADMLDLPNLREHRGRIDRARITSAGAPGPEAALLAGWFASRVKRARVELETGPFPQETGADSGSAVRAPPVHEGQVTRLDFEAAPAAFSIHRERDVLVAEVRGDDDGQIVQRLRLPAETPGKLLGMELSLLSGIDELYAAALREGARLSAPHAGAHR